MQPQIPLRPSRRAPLAFLLALAACGGGAVEDSGDAASAATPGVDAPAVASPPPPPQAAAQTVAAVDPCALLEPGELAADAGVRATAGEPSVSGGARVCTWADPAGRSAVVQVHPSLARHAESRAAFAETYGGEVEEIDIGDDTFLIGGTSGAVPTATVGSRQGPTAFTVQVMAADGDPAALRRQALALTQRILAKL